MKVFNLIFLITIMVSTTTAFLRHCTTKDDCKSKEDCHGGVCSFMFEGEVGNSDPSQSMIGNPRNFPAHPLADDSESFDPIVGHSGSSSASLAKDSEVFDPLVGYSAPSQLAADYWKPPCKKNSDCGHRYVCLEDKRCHYLFG